METGIFQATMMAELTGCVPATISFDSSTRFYSLILDSQGSYSTYLPIANPNADTCLS